MSARSDHHLDRAAGHDDEQRLHELHPGSQNVKNLEPIISPIRRTFSISRRNLKASTANLRVESRLCTFQTA